MSLFLALIAWHFTIGLLLSIAAAGIASCAFGVRYQRRGLTVLGCAAAAIIGVIFFIDMSGVEMWDGSFTLFFDVTVIDETSGNPVSQANVDVRYARYMPVQKTNKTDEDGNARFSRRFPCGGTDSRLRITRSSWEYIPLGHYWVNVTADGHDEVEISLAEAVGTTRWNFGQPRISPFVIRLHVSGSKSN